MLVCYINSICFTCKVRDVQTVEAYQAPFHSRKKLIQGTQGHPPSSVEEERAFSAVGLFVTKLRSRLSDKSIADSYSATSEFLCSHTHWLLCKFVLICLIVSPLKDAHNCPWKWFAFYRFFFSWYCFDCYWDGVKKKGKIRTMFEHFYNYPLPQTISNAYLFKTLLRIIMLVDFYS